MGGTKFDCIQCPCYTPRVINSTCELDPVNRLPSCMYCEDGYTGSLCNQYVLYNHIINLYFILHSKYLIFELDFTLITFDNMFNFFSKF